MALNKNDRSEIEKKAKTYGYSTNSSGSGMSNGSNKISFSPSGGTVNIKGSSYTSLSDANKSKKW